MALLTYHSARRGFLGFLTYLTGSDGVTRGGVIPAMTLVNSAGVEAGAATAPFSIQPTGTAYETVAASQTAQVLGGAGAIGDLINGVLIIPASTSPGAVTLLDGATSIVIFTGGASSVVSLVPFMVYLGVKSVSGPWKLTTGTNVSAIGVGTFT